MMEVTISYNCLIEQFLDLFPEFPKECAYTDMEIVVVRGYPIGNYVPVVDFWPVYNTCDEEYYRGHLASSFFFSRLDDNQEMMSLSDVFEELISMNEATITIDEGFDDVDLFRKLAAKMDTDCFFFLNNGQSYDYLDEADEYDEEQYGFCDYEETDESNLDMANILKSIDLLLDKVEILKHNEKNGEIVNRVIQKLMRLAI